jgi:hypothetical protein
MKKHWKRWLAVPLLLLVVVLAWLFWPDRRLAQAKALQKELFSPAARDMSEEQRRQKWQQYRQLTEKLSAAQRDQLAQEARKRRQAEMGRYFAMSPAEKTKYLDDQIRRMEQARKQREANGQGSGGAGGGQQQGGSGARQGSGDRSAASRDQSRQQRLDSSTPAERALVAQYRKDLGARRAQLGLPPLGAGFGPPR